ncbi:hypothetical protein AB0F13_16720 [Streptomyces sp. NPDC026206]|uniref:hypothetical protein n=1 Tax=Streptomyces sp. NPDC026206 TaxID=3157089 RepID=UPI0033E8A1C9
MTGAGRFSVRIRLQIVVLSVVALATLSATWQFSGAGGAYQDAVREDVKRQAALREDVRHVYADEAPDAFRAAAARIRTDALRPLKDQGRLAASEYALAAQTALQFRSRARPGSLLGDDAYVHRELGYDIPHRLADLQKRSAELYALDPDATLHDGDSWALWGRVSVWVAFAAVLLAAAAANVLRPVRWRHPPAPPPAPRVLRKPELLPQPATAPAGDRRRTARFLLLLSALLLALPFGQMVAACDEQRAQAEAARRASGISLGIAVSGQRTAFLTTSLQAAAAADLQSAARLSAALETGSSPDAAHEQAVAAAETTAAGLMARTARYMGRPAEAADRVDPATATALRTEPLEWRTMLTEQQRQVDRAEVAGERGFRLAAATALAVLAQLLVAAAVSAHRLRRPAAAAVLLSAGLTALALV